MPEPVSETSGLFRVSVAGGPKKTLYFQANDIRVLVPLILT
jgi:hypothetical protein